MKNLKIQEASESLKNPKRLENPIRIIKNTENHRILKESRNTVKFRKFGKYKECEEYLKPKYLKNSKIYKS